jgi:hypothetical protein
VGHGGGHRVGGREWPRRLGSRLSLCNRLGLCNRRGGCCGLRCSFLLGLCLGSLDAGRFCLLGRSLLGGGFHGSGLDRFRGRERPRTRRDSLGGLGLGHCFRSLGFGLDLGGFLVGHRREGRRGLAFDDLAFAALDLVALATVTVAATTAAAAARFVAMRLALEFLAGRSGRRCLGGCHRLERFRDLRLAGQRDGRLGCHDLGRVQLFTLCFGRSALGRDTFGRGSFGRDAIRTFGTFGTITRLARLARCAFRTFATLRTLGALGALAARALRLCICGHGRLFARLAGFARLTRLARRTRRLTFGLDRLGAFLRTCGFHLAFVTLATVAAGASGRRVAAAAGVALATASALATFAGGR